MHTCRLIHAIIYPFSQTRPCLHLKSIYKVMVTFTIYFICMAKCAPLLVTRSPLPRLVLWLWAHLGTTELFGDTVLLGKIQEELKQESFSLHKIFGIFVRMCDEWEPGIVFITNKCVLCLKWLSSIIKILAFSNYISPSLVHLIHLKPFSFLHSLNIYWNQKSTIWGVNTVPFTCPRKSICVHIRIFSHAMAPPISNELFPVTVT